MKKTLTALFIFTLGCSSQISVNSQDKKTGSRATSPEAASPIKPADTDTSRQAQAMKGLRDSLLTSSPEEVGLSEEYAKANVWGVLMEVTFPGGTVTVVSMRDGTASVYASTGGGVLGGYVAQKEAKVFVTEAEKHLASMTPTKSFPYPQLGRIKFYVLTRDGVFTAEADEKELLSAQHSMSPLFRTANEVLVRLRTAQERAKPDD